MNENKPGTTASWENVERDYLNFESTEQLAGVWTEKLANNMLERARSFKGISESEILRVVSDVKEQEKYIGIYGKLLRGLGKTAKKYELDKAWTDLQEAAIVRYRSLQMRASAPPLPEQSPVMPAEQELVEIIDGVEIIPDELPDTLKPDLKQWQDWRARQLNNDTIGKLNFEFANALSRELKSLTPDQVKDIQRIYESIVEDMYKVTYLGEQNPREQIGRALELYWNAVLNAAERLAPATPQP